MTNKEYLQQFLSKEEQRKNRIRLEKNAVALKNRKMADRCAYIIGNIFLKHFPTARRCVDFNNTEAYESAIEHCISIIGECDDYNHLFGDLPGELLILPENER